MNMLVKTGGESERGIFHRNLEGHWELEKPFYMGDSPASRD